MTLKRIVLECSLMLIILLGNLSVSNVATSEYNMILTLKTSAGGILPSYADSVAQYLSGIYIKVNIKVEEWLFLTEI